jgi:hypothetical protein
VERLATRFDAMRVVTEQRLAAAEQVHGSLPAEREAFERGELVSVRQTLRRLSSAPPPRAARAPLVRRERCAGDYQASLAELTAAVALARASDLVPEGAGPYNPLRIASDLLECIRAVSPIYLSSQLSRFEELTSMLALPALPEPPSKTTATGRPSPSKTTATGKASPSKPSRPSSAAPRASKPATKAAKARRRSA